MSRKYFGTDGVRGRVGEHPITPQFVMHLGYAAGKVLASSGAQTWRCVFINDNIGAPGSQIVEQGDDGVVTVRYVYKNNGRGPEQNERLRIADDGGFSEYHVTGLTTMGAPMDEHFDRHGDVAAWHSTTARGRAIRSTTGARRTRTGATSTSSRRKACSSSSSSTSGQTFASATPMRREPSAAIELEHRHAGAQVRPVREVGKADDAARLRTLRRGVNRPWPSESTLHTFS